MTTLQEKIAKTRADGWEAARHEIHAKIGEAEVYAYSTERSSLYAMDLCDRGRKLLLEVDQVESKVLEFLTLSAAGPSAEERARQRQLHLDDANAVAIAKEKAAAKAKADADAAVVDESIPRLPGTTVEQVDAGVEEAEAEIDRELTRLGCGVGAVEVECWRDDLGLQLWAELGYLGDWRVEREAVRVLGALRQLADGAGAEAVKAVLCGLAETPKPLPWGDRIKAALEAAGVVAEVETFAHAAECYVKITCDGRYVSGLLAAEALAAIEGAEPEKVWDALSEARAAQGLREALGDDPVEAEIARTEQAIGAELTRCGADGVQTSCSLSGYTVPPTLVAHLEGGEWSDRKPAAEVLDALRLLPDECGEAAVKARLLYGQGLPDADPGRPADLPRKAPAKKRKTRAEADGDDVVVGGKS